MTWGFALLCLVFGYTLGWAGVSATKHWQFYALMLMLLIANELGRTSP